MWIVDNNSLPEFRVEFSRNLLSGSRIIGRCLIRRLWIEIAGSLDLNRTNNQNTVEVWDVVSRNPVNNRLGNGVHCWGRRRYQEERGQQWKHVEIWRWSQRDMPKDAGNYGEPKSNGFSREFVRAPLFFFENPGFWRLFPHKIGQGNLRF